MTVRMSATYSDQARGEPVRLSTSVIAAALLLGGVQLATAASAFAYDNMYPTSNYGPICLDGGPGDPFCQTDNAGVTYFAESSIGTIGRGNIIDNATGQLDPTDLNTEYDPYPSYSGSAETDIIYQSSYDIPDDLLGLTWCNDAVNTEDCDQAYVRVLAGNPSHALICHETGHAVGLTHGDDASPKVDPETTTSLGCMRNPLTTDQTLGSHNVSEINATY